MLNRDPPADAAERASQKARTRRLAQREYRRRYNSGMIKVSVEIDGLDGAVAKKLAATKWLRGELNRETIGDAISKILADAAEQ